MTEYLTLDDALQITQSYGFHVRDAGLLASALARPSASMFGEDAYATLDRKAAALLESLVRNHPLVDGNKRTGWTIMVAFLWINGWKHDFGTDDGFALVVGVAEGALGLDDAEARISAHRIPRDE
ncbi:MAG: type II toxin-antitoxin system death-on-curing family toxin [Microbacterium sp.]|uniref:type II toxin-antitoxin system death-on-curing family toxin n=1 Tax=Microbacterium sp. TaxID=51671 RepID=UPI001AD538A3|nr:Fic family protein [Microbacterium sp.]MBN9154011.1 type II toxin-antitoxin system death-on-curing family toxin [Microbacterium sp.]MBN9173380.1 type II toxin-antitoxin system death-on-curing family toxin [Microbacterium sp.]